MITRAPGTFMIVNLFTYPVNKLTR